MLILLTAFSCSNAGPPQHTFLTYENEGTTRRVSTGLPKFSEPILEFTKVLELSNEVSNPEFLLGYPWAFFPTGAGEYFLLDSGRTESRLLVFGADGRPIRSIGDNGDGPGEFRTPRLLRPSRQMPRNASIFDWSLQRLTDFGPDGTLLQTTRIPQGTTEPVGALFRVRGDTLVSVAYSTSPSPEALLRIRAMDSGGRSLFRWESNPVRTGVLLPGETVPQYTPFHPIPHVYVDDNRGILVSDGEHGALEWYSFTGSKLEIVEVTGIDRSTSSDHWMRFDLEWSRRIGRVSNGARQNARKMRDALRNEIPEEMPPWTFIYVDDAGYYWLRIPEQIDPWITGPVSFTYRLLSPVGEYLCDVATPPENWPGNANQFTLPLSVVDGRLHQIELRPDGELVPTVYQIRSIVEGIKYF